MIGHCFLMIDDLKKAYSSYQQALYYMPNPHVRLSLEGLPSPVLLS